MKTAFFGEPKLKKALLVRLREHQRLDAIVQGKYYEDGKGCHLGCITHRAENAHEATEQLFGIPLEVAYWLEAVFEGLPLNDAKRWVTESIEAIPVGADLSLTHHHLGVWLQSGESGLFPTTEVNHRVAELHYRAIDGVKPSNDEWSAAESAAEFAAEFAESAGSAESARSARSAAESAAEFAGSAAESAESAARSAGFAARSARSAYWQAIAAKSISIFASTSVTECEDCDQCISQTMAFLNTPIQIS